MKTIIKHIKHRDTKTRRFILCFSVSLCLCVQSFSQVDKLKDLFQSPPESAKPWVFWYWMKAAISKEGITADLEAYKQNGIGGVYLVPINGADNPPLLTPTAEQLSPQWWTMVRFAFDEADRLQHVGDTHGFLFQKVGKGIAAADSRM